MPKVLQKGQNRYQNVKNWKFALFSTIINFYKNLCENLQENHFNQVENAVLVGLERLPEVAPVNVWDFRENFSPTTPRPAFNRFQSHDTGPLLCL